MTNDTGARNDDKAGAPKINASPVAKPVAPRSKSAGSGQDAQKLDNLSASLRRAYQNTVEESVPDSMMDLLRKLG